MIRLEDVHVTFNAGTVNEVRALRGLWLTLGDGELVTVVGSNGAGKSTFVFTGRIGKRKLGLMARVPPKVREIAWKAQSRLTARFRALAARGEKLTVACTAIARELAGFMWAVAREVQPQSNAA